MARDWKGPSGRAYRNVADDLPSAVGSLLPTPRTSDTNGPGEHGQGGPDLRTAVSLLPTPSASNPNDGEDLDQWHARRERVKETSDAGNGFGTPLAVAVRLATFGDYAPAIARHELMVGRPAPNPTTDGRLSPRFVEWMMTLPEGWVTDTPGLSRTAQLRALGNGVVPQQAAAALELLDP
jgi:DNA (cytosine-5)-methyltransferase 1